jgi:hypothetical protein
VLRVEQGSEYGARLITTEPLAAGQVIARLTGNRERAKPTYLSIQIGPDRHLDDLGLLSYLNHSCRPNAIVNTAERVVVAARDVAAGEELTFFYPSTEWDMDRPFRCLCGAPECLGTVAGARYLAPETLARYFLNPHIRRLLAQAAGAAAPAAVIADEGRKQAE